MCANIEARFASLSYSNEFRWVKKASLRKKVHKRHDIIIKTTYVHIHTHIHFFVCCQPGCNSIKWHRKKFYSCNNILPLFKIKLEKTFIHILDISQAYRYIHFLAEFKFSQLWAFIFFMLDFRHEEKFKCAPCSTVRTQLCIADSHVMVKFVGKRSIITWKKLSLRKVRLKENFIFWQKVIIESTLELRS